ncbi:MAG: ATP-binding protein [Vicinamibacterales bacterium]
MNPHVSTLVSTTAALAALIVVLVYAVTRVRASARAPWSQDDSPAASTLVTTALHDAVVQLKTRERAQLARAEASERLNDDIVRNLSSGLLVVDPGGAIRSVNPAAARLLGLTAECVGRPFDEVLRSVAPMAAIVAEGLRTGHPVVRRSVDLRRCERPTGSATVLGVTVSPLFSGEGLFEGVICLFTDLSVVFELEEQLRLKDGLARLGELTAGIAHEFRNGLSTIHGYARLIDLQRVPEETRPLVEGIRAETAMLGRVLTKFLEFAKPTPLSLARVDLSRLVDQAIADMDAELAAVAGRVEKRGEFAAIEGDEVCLRQVLANVLRNALESCAGVPRAPVIEIASHVERASATTILSIGDNGAGFTEAAGASAFVPFFTTKRAGTGLGLALVQKIVVMHNGRVTAGNRPGGGAVVEIQLPGVLDT